MKSNEIIQEGPLDFVKRVGAGIAGAMDTTSSFKTGYQQAASDQQLTDYAKKSYPAWNQTIVSLKQQGVTDPQLGPELQQWASEYFDVQAPPFQGPVNAQSSMEYLKKLWAIKTYAKKGAPKPAPGPAPAPGPTPGPAPAPGPTPGPAPAPKPGEETPPKPGEETAPKPGETPAPAPAPAVDPAHAMFKDPAAFKAEWDKFVASNPSYKLIADPELLSTLKNMWMRSGGLKAESKKNKGKRV